MKKQTFTVPVWALSYLCNRDKSGLNLGELEFCQHFERQNKVYSFLEVEGEEFFSTTNDFSTHLAGMCTKAVFHVRYTSAELFARIIHPVDCRFGAPMGRHSRPYPLKDGGFSDYSKHAVNWGKTAHFDRRVPVDPGGYDRGGAYWGNDQLRVRFSKDGQFWQFYEIGDEI